MKKKKRPITLLEIMIVIFLIGLIGGVVGYNMKGSLDEGKAFKSKEGAAKIENILNLQIASGWDPAVLQDPQGVARCLKDSGMVKDVDQILKDGWGTPYTITVDAHGDISVESQKLKDYEAKKKGAKTRAESHT